jgi:ATP-dependent helicase/DNAse subunit B
MGILETRALDFKNLIVLSVNEGVLPAVSSASSFIPFSLREAFGLPSVNHQESIYAYHFYRLLQRAENVTFAYNSNSEGLRSGEMSRFLIQMNYDKILKPEFLNLSFEIRSHNAINEIVERTGEDTARLNTLFGSGKMLSPSAINTWLSCRMKFFYRYVCGLNEPEKISGEIDPAIFGNILHEIMRDLYQGYTGKVLNRELLDCILKDDELLGKTVNHAIREKFRKGEDGFERGNELIVKDILLAFTRRILQTDRNMSPITILKLENKLVFTLSINGNLIRIGGIADRVDVVEGTTRIVDYKTGTVSEKITSINELFTEDRKKDHDGWLQTLIYCEAYLQSAAPYTTLRPSIYKIRKMTGGPISDKLKMKPDRNSEELAINDYRDVREAVVNGLTEVLGKIFNKDEPFAMTKELRAKCSYCPYKGLCLR